LARISAISKRHYRSLEYRQDERRRKRPINRDAAQMRWAGAAYINGFVATKPTRLVPLANKTARIAWTILARRQALLRI
jgi:hypothetical protein